MKTRRSVSSPHPEGLTLLELLVAIVISGMVALLAYSAIGSGLDTLSRVDAHRRESQSLALFRPLIGDAIRHIADAGVNAPSVFQITRSSAGSSGTSLVFLTRGIESPLGSSGLWKLTLSPSLSGLRVEAVPLEDVTQSPLVSLVPGVREMRVRVLPTRQDELWVTNWESPRQHPYAVKIELLDSAGKMMDAPLVIATSFERGG